MVAGLRDTAPFQRAYLERPRGHSKTTDIGSMALEILYLSPIMLEGVAAADDRDQARLIRNAVKGMVVSNPWLSERISVQDYRIVNKQTGSALEIISNDAGSSYGFTPHFIIVDELTHWKKQDLWVSLFSSSAKRPKCMLVIIANAGMGEGTSWQWELRESCRTNPRWYFSTIDGPQASWITEDSLAEQRAILSPLAYQRLWLNKWVRESSSGLEWADIVAATTLDGPQQPDSHLYYIASLDIGVTNDHSALVIIGIDPIEGRYRLARVLSWKPSDYGGQVKLSEVREAVLAMHRLFKFRRMIYDPWNALDIMQALRTQGEQMVQLGQCPTLEVLPYEFRGVGQLDMAGALLRVFKNRQIDIYHDEDLEKDLMRIQMEDKGVGYKVTSRSDEMGHVDRAIALAFGLVEATTAMNELREPRIDDGLGDSLI